MTKQIKDFGISEYARMVKHSYPIKFDQLHFVMKYVYLDTIIPLLIIFLIKISENIQYVGSKSN